MNKQTTADRLFDLYREYTNYEEDVFDRILICLDIDPQFSDDWPLEDFGHDHYDHSFELYEVDPNWKPTEIQLQRCWDLGFVQCWINYTDGTESHYYKK